MPAPQLTDFISAEDYSFARVLYASGFGPRRIAARLALDERLVENLAFGHQWPRTTPRRYVDAPLGYRIPVMARCADCLARYGEEWGKPRPCPHCGCALRGAPSQMELSECFA